MEKPPPKRPAVDEAQSKAWQDRRAVRVAQLQSEAEHASGDVDKCKAVLEAESEWTDRKAKREAKLAALLGKFPGLPKVSVQIAQLQRSYGAAEAEKSFAVREANMARAALERIVGQGASAICESCGQGIPAATLEQCVDAAERRVVAADGQIRTSDSRLSNIASDLHDLNTGGSAEREAIERSIEECRGLLAECERAVEEFTRIRSNMEVISDRLNDTNRMIAEVEKEVNPSAGAS